MEERPVVFRKAVSADMPDIVDFANYVFSYDHTNHDFRTLLPKLFGETQDTAACHFLAVQEHPDRIRACVGSYPISMHVLGEPLRVAGIGTVSVHPYARRSGYMRKLMQMALQEMQDAQVDMACLGGIRQRYAYFGFEQAGPTPYFSMDSRYGLRHCLADVDTDHVQLLTDSAMRPYLPQMQALYARQPLYVDRLPDFETSARSWRYEVCAILISRQFAGYLVFNPKSADISEWYMLDYGQTLPVLKAYGLQHRNQEFTVSPAVYQTELIRQLEPVCEGISTQTCCNFAVFNFEKVIRLFLRLKASCTPLLPGSLTVHIQDRGKFRLTVTREGQCDVAVTDGPCDITVDYRTALKLLYGSPP